MTFKQITEEGERLSQAATQKRGNLGRRNRRYKGTEVGEDLASLRNGRKISLTGTELVQKSIVQSEIRKVKEARLHRAWQESKNFYSELDGKLMKHFYQKDNQCCDRKIETTSYFRKKGFIQGNSCL